MPCDIGHHRWTKRPPLPRGALIAGCVLVIALLSAIAARADAQTVHHPRLYFTAADLPQLRDLQKVRRSRQDLGQHDQVGRLVRPANSAHRVDSHGRKRSAV